LDLDPEAPKSPVTKMIDPPPRGARDTYTRVKGRRKASVENRVLEIAVAMHTDD
jgi:hypothetical protein